MRFPVFRVFYSTTFTFLTLLLLGLLLISPADAIFQSYINNQLDNVVVVAAVYVLTFLVAAFIYATRLYATRTHLASLPRSARVPTAAAGPAVRRLVAAGLARAAAIAHAAHPRDLAAERAAAGGLAPVPPRAIYRPGEAPPPGSTRQQRELLTPAFGRLARAGWTSPASPDLPGVCFAPVIAELPHLLEAKAVSLAPPATAIPEGLGDDDDDDQMRPDPVAVALLQRPAAYDVRAYVAHLSSLGALADPDVAAAFVALYERARFGGAALHEGAFRDLMARFAALLRSLQSPDPVALRELARGTSSSSSSSGAHSVHSAPATLRSQPSAGELTRPALPLRSATTTSAASAVLARLASPTPSRRSTRQAGRWTETDDMESATPASYATPFFTPYRTSLSSNDGDRSAGSSGAEDNTDSEHSRQRTPSRRTPRPPPRTRILQSSLSRGIAIEPVQAQGLGLELMRGVDTPESFDLAPQPAAQEHVVEDSEAAHGVVSHDSSRDYVSFASSAEAEHDKTKGATGRAERTEYSLRDPDLTRPQGDDDNDDDDDDSGSVIRQVVTALEQHVESGSEAGSVVIRPEDRGVGGLVPVPVIVDGDDTQQDIGLEMRMVGNGPHM